MKGTRIGLLVCGFLAMLSAALGTVPAAHATTLTPATPVAVTTPPPAIAATHHYAPAGAPTRNGSMPATPLFWLGGTVLARNVRTYAIFWGPGFTTGYKNLITQYLADVAAASGTNNNVYANDTQYFGTWNGQNLHIAYQQHFIGAWSDTTLPASGCSDTHGGTVRCLTDDQIRTEVSLATISNLQNGWQPNGLNNDYLVFLPDGVSTCDNSGCAFAPNTGFCAYHGATSTWDGAVTYANMPFLGSHLTGCHAWESPNNHPAADAVINAISHETNETITDPVPGTGWVDLYVAEIGDKCVDDFGSPLGGTAGHLFNQMIHGNHYWLQEEWSNSAFACVQRPS